MLDHFPGNGHLVGRLEFVDDITLGNHLNRHIKVRDFLLQLRRNLERKVRFNRNFGHFHGVVVDVSDLDGVGTYLNLVDDVGAVEISDSPSGGTHNLYRCPDDAFAGFLISYRAFHLSDTGRKCY